MNFSYVDKEYNIFKNKINSCKLDNIIAENLDSNEIDY